MSDAALHLAAGRAMAAQQMPYLSLALYAVSPRPSTELQTAGVDRAWRMYYNPDFILGLSVAEVATVWLHEVGHLIRDHHGRSQRHLVPDHRGLQWNKAGDATINADLRDAGLTVFDWMVFPETLHADASEQDTTERMYDLQGGHGDPPPGQGAPDPEAPDGDGSGDPGTPGDPGEESCDGDGPGGTEQGQDGDTGNEPSAGGNAAGPDGQENPAGSGDGPGDGPGGESEGAGEDQGGGVAHGGDCGSAAGGSARPWEDPADDTAVSEGRGQRIRSQVAAATIEYANSGRGTVPAGMQRWAEEIVSPKVDWRKELRSIVRRRAAMLAGRSDYTYSRTRRLPTIPRVIFPTMADRPPPIVRAVVDTSGSMRDTDLAQCVAEIGAIVSRLSRGGGGVDVLSCDAAASQVERITRPGNVNLTGGGGTDMRVGIAAAVAAEPRADVIITLTDGGTPWPAEVPAENPDAKYVAVILVRGAANRLPTRTPPDWMHTIIVDSVD